MAQQIKNDVRKLRGRMSRTELAQRAGVTEQTISYLESEKRNVRIETAFRLATVFGVPVEEIFKNPFKSVEERVNRVVKI